ncbi:glycoside-pentoside-hexuronide (GPH):cation symporter [Kluyvera intermedia]|uniref:MFS transporter n=1 Tax=Kluyvera intermedia TaxID=61648 RepID=A0ABX6DP88_KLUIN|nr:glycoside-pentoside-hexuronide (GPH):cation symporter [Kluyvera intermedia]QGH30414.1 MFS transporter [Kluyvera intermedia]QGH39396.1 MFS transporter [Kluyvera intermedia]
MNTKVTRKEKISYGLGDMASHIGLDNVIIFLTFYYTDVVGLPAAFVGTMFLLARTADAIIDPAMGYMADRTRSRWGKFRPWMLWLALPFGASCLLTYAVPESLDMTGKMIFASVSYTFMMLMYTAINIPYCSMGAVITPDNNERISLQSWRFFLATLGGALSTFFMMPLAEFLGGADKLAGYRWAMVIMSCVAVAMFWICFANTRERIKAPATHNNYLAELRDLLRNDQWRVVAVLVMTNIGFGVIRLGAMMYFVTYYLGSAAYFMWMLAAHIIGKAAGSVLAKRLTRDANKVQMFGYCAVLAGLLSIGLFFAPKSVYVLVPLTFIVSTLYQSTTTLMWVMMADVADYAEWRQGKRMDGVIFSTFLAVLKLGMALSGAIVGWTLGFSGYVANAPDQTSLAMHSIVALFTIVPGLLSLGAFVTLRWYKLDDQTMHTINLAKNQSLVKG